MPKPKTTWFKFATVVLPNLTHNVYNFLSAYTHNRVSICWSFALSASVTDSLSAILNLLTKHFLWIAIVKQGHFKFIHVLFF